jgi:hypothetical protein
VGRVDTIMNISWEVDNPGKAYEELLAKDLEFGAPEMAGDLRDCAHSENNRIVSVRSELLFHRVGPMGVRA